MNVSPATGSDLQVLQQQLGRVPRGVVGVGARDSAGQPVVVVTAPRLPDGSPFPTTFYLTQPQWVRACSVLESEGVMEALQDWVQNDPTVQTAYGSAHRDYVERRAALGAELGLDVPEIAGISAGGMPSRVKCLHALVAHALAVGPGVNPVGDRAIQIIQERGLLGSSGTARLAAGGETSVGAKAGQASSALGGRGVSETARGDDGQAPIATGQEQATAVEDGRRGA